ncbi:MAG: DegT/DnrJ/EryC1/StrS family aminotransferase [Acidobacteria bacterium]|nr:DegT/DnrJ/EryC1/StrS family aminotransferase [Acidobacteriota bacterium]
MPFIDLRPGDDAADVRAAIERVLARGWFVLGPEVEAFEAAFAAASGARHAVGVASGTDAVALLLRAAGIGRGDEVIVPAMTAAYTALAVVSIGARPIFVDVDPERLTLDPDACAAAVASRTKAIVPVHLYGQPADLAGVGRVADRHGLALVEDCCQAHLATCQGVPVGTRGTGGAFSFYPTKNLGALGDGGAVLTNDAAVAHRVRILRNGGQTDRYHHVEAGINSRLDEIQAAVLRERLSRLPRLTARRRELAAFYRRHLTDAVIPVRECDPGHVYHLFPVRSARRDALQAHLRTAGIETLIHYPVALPGQQAFAAFAPADCPVAARAARELLSLPLHPRLADADAARVADAVGAFWKGRVLA